MTVAHVDDELVGRVFASTIASDLPADYWERQAPTRSPGIVCGRRLGRPMTTMTPARRFFLLVAYHHREGTLLRGPRG